MRHLGVRYARLTDRPSLRLGLRIIAAGAICGPAFVAVHALMPAGDDLGDGLGRFGGTVALPLEMATESLLLVWVTVPSWGPRLGARLGGRPGGWPTTGSTGRRTLCGGHCTGPIRTSRWFPRT